MDYIQIRNLSKQMYQYARNQDYNIVYPMRDFYTEGAKSPTTALLLMKDEFEKTIVIDAVKDYKHCIDTNKPYMQDLVENTQKLGLQYIKASSHPIVQGAQTNFINAINHLYPITGAARIALINKNAISADEIVPVVRGINKLSLKHLIRKYKRQSL